MIGLCGDVRRGGRSRRQRANIGGERDPARPGDVVQPPDAIPIGRRMGGREVGVFRLGEEIVAYDNICPHLGGPVCQGSIFNRVTETLSPEQTSRGLAFMKNRHIVCPWHGFEFDLETGCHPSQTNPKLRRVETELHNGDIYLHIALRKAASRRGTNAGRQSLHHHRRRRERRAGHCAAISGRGRQGNAGGCGRRRAWRGRRSSVCHVCATVEDRLTQIIGQNATEFLDGIVTLHRHVDPEEVAKSVLYLASSMSSYTTGSTLMVDGGVMA
jgi:nitrite reductase/ring-hydroxylating ferredoxin subunit